MRFYDCVIDEETGIHSFKAEAQESEIDFCVTYTVNHMVQLGMLTLDESIEGEDVEIVYIPMPRKGNQ